MKKNWLAFIILGVVAALAVILGLVTQTDTDNPFDTINSEGETQQFARDDLRTDTSKASIDLNAILNGGPGKDGIPALTNPSFVSIAEAENSLDSDVAGILVSFDNETKFYPYNILVWHEIANDTVGNTDVVVTFCPLCGSALVFSPHVEDQKLEFGVSGKLYESNLLMYDRTTDSLWSQILGEAVVGDFVGTKLEHLPFQVLTFDEVKEKYPEASVLSEDTGHRRNYSFYPYGDYETNNEVIFPVSVSDQRFPPKEIMYASEIDGVHFVFPLFALESAGSATLKVGGETVRAVAEDGEVTLFREDDSVHPGYHAMWFSWATHHQDGGVVWIPR